MFLARRVPVGLPGLVLLILALAGSVLAQELYISNRPFKGEVIKAGSGLQVELAPLIQALKLDLKVESGQVRVGEKSVPVTQSASGKGMVSLPEFAAAAGLTVRKNPDFGHTDVYASTTSPTGEWGDAAAGTSSGPGAATSTASYSIKVPPDYEMVNDPDLMQAIVGMAAKKSSTNLPEGAMTFEFILSPKQGSAKRGYLMLMVMKLPGPVPAGEEDTFVKVVTQGMQQKGQLISGPTATNIGGLRYHKSLMKTQEGAKTNMMESYLHLAGSLGKVYWLALVDEEATYSTSFASLRNVVDTFRLK